MPVTLSTEVGGRTLTIESGRLARLAGGSVTVRYGDTMVLGTANRSDPRPGLDFFPLTVDFEERMYAAGKIPGGFIKRESRPSEAAILAARLTDRPIRPLFPEGYKDDVQVVVTVLSTDQENDPDVIGTIAASAALTISDVPFQGPIAAARIGRVNGEFVLNPTYSQLAESELDLIVSGTRDAIMMVEAGAQILPEAVMAEAILFGHRSLAPIIDLQLQLAREVGKAKRIPYLEPGTDSVLTFLDDMAAKKPFVVFDVETTSRDAKIGSLVEIAAVKVQGGKIADRWSTLVDPGQPIVGHQLHGLTDKDVKGAPSPAEAARQFLAWAGEATLVGHNVGFDLGFLEAALGDGTRIEQGRYLDTLTLAREAWPDQDVFKLADLTAFFGLEPRPTHRALPDAEATAELLLLLAKDLPVRAEAFKKAVAETIHARAKGTPPADADAALEKARRASRLSKSLTTLLHKKTVRHLVLTEGMRMDGRD
ncbi:MAG: exonuclease domain-containing protein, partial [Candidatus Limnocylindrales bacterium]